MADDTTLFTTNLESLVSAIKTFKKFEACSGLKINLNKTEIIPIGKVKQKNIQLPSEIEQIKIKNGPFKALGIWFSDNQLQSEELNLVERLKKMQTLINIWKQRNLSLKGKVTIIRSLILPQIQFLFNMLYIPKKTLDTIDKMLFLYLWNNKPAKV